MSSWKCCGGSDEHEKNCWKIKTQKELSTLTAKVKRYEEVLKDLRSEMTRSESQIDHSWCIDQICEALNQTSEDKE